MAPAEDEARAGRELADEHAQGVEDVAAGQLVQVVEHERERPPAFGEHGAEVLQGRRADRRGARPSADTHSGSTGSISSIERATYVSSAAGSFSAAVSDTHAVGRGSAAASSAMNVDLP